MLTIQKGNRMKKRNFLSIAIATAICTSGSLVIAEEVQPDATEWENRTALGYSAVGGYEGVAVGAYAGASATTQAALYNTLVGYVAAYSLTSGDANCIFGTSAGYNLSSGNENVFIGTDSGRMVNTTGSVFIGNDAGYSMNRSNTLVIENSKSNSPPYLRRVR